MLKSPTPNRMHQYKNGGRSGNSFRDDLRKKCVDKLRGARLRNMNLRRNIEEDVSTIIKQTIGDEMGSTSLDEQIQMYESLREELFREEYEMIQSLNAEWEADLLSHLEQPDVFCPKCRLQPMLVNRQICQCRSCGFAQPFSPFQPVPSPADLAELFRTVFSSHADTGCELHPEPVQRGTELGFACSKCNFAKQIL